MCTASTNLATSTSANSRTIVSRAIWASNQRLRLQGACRQRVRREFHAPALQTPGASPQPSQREHATRASRPPAGSARRSPRWTSPPHTAPRRAAAAPCLSGFRPVARPAQHAQHDRTLRTRGSCAGASYTHEHCDTLCPSAVQRGVNYRKKRKVDNSSQRWLRCSPALLSEGPQPEVPGPTHLPAPPRDKG